MEIIAVCVLRKASSVVPIPPGIFTLASARRIQRRRQHPAENPSITIPALRITGYGTSRMTVDKPGRKQASRSMQVAIDE